MLEAHNGGEYDATNIFPNPVVTGVTKIGKDHIKQLGPTIENIAWHKSGIFKVQRPAFSTVQDDDVTAVLRHRASEKDVTLEFVDLDHSLPNEALPLRPDVQKLNASLALSLTRAWLKERGTAHSQDMTAEDIRSGVEHFSWPGRFQQINQEGNQWFLDGAHNDMSIEHAAQWFAEMVAPKET